MTDFLKFDDGRRCLFIASEVRCGSTFIAETIAYELKRSLGFELWDLAQEHFSYLDDNATPAQAMETWARLHYDASGFVAAKIMCKSLSQLHRLAQLSPELRRAFFGERARWLIVRRRDRIAQATSLALARKTQIYHYYGDPELAADNGAELTLGDIDAALKAVALSDIYLDTFAASLRPERSFSFFYNDFMSDQPGHLARVHELCGFPPFDAAHYVNDSKIKPTGGSVKKAYGEQFRRWFLANNG
ncbi:MAG: hypothetical protein KGM15_11035 [Pseudomonadota bacterium]|nr:hypothetical protein [Pseudomonadota bacterium]